MPPPPHTLPIMSRFLVLSVKYHMSMSALGLVGAHSEKLGREACDLGTWYGSAGISPKEIPSQPGGVASRARFYWNLTGCSV